MLKAIIVEDIQPTAELLKEMLQNLYTDIEVIGIANNVEEATALIYQEKPKLIFLDVNLEAESGFDIISKTNKENYEVIVTTAHAQHALEAIKNEAIDFILKPYDIQELIQAVNKARKRLEFKSNAVNKADQPVNAANKLSVSTLEDVLLIELDRILYIKADSSYSNIKLADGSAIVASKTLSFYEAQLSGQTFYRVHKSFLVNLKYISKFIRTKAGVLVMTDGTQIPISQDKRKEIMDLLNI